MRLLLHRVPLLLVELRALSRARHSVAGRPLGRGQPRRADRRAPRRPRGPVPPLSLPHHSQLHQGLPQGPEPRRRHLLAQTQAGRARRMIDHIGMPVSDVARSTEFYLKALAPLGISIVMEVSAEESGRGAAVGFGANSKPFFWIGEAEGLGAAHVHVAFAAPSRAVVDAFYRAAIAAGGK